MHAEPDITVIIVNYNAREMLRDCLASLRRHAAKRARVIVVDNASRDGSGDMVREAFPEVRLIDSGGNLGFGRANNLALPHVTTPWVAFLNPDTTVPPGSLDAMADFMRAHDDVGALGPAMIHPDGRVQELGLQWFPTPWTELVKLLFVSTGTRKGLGRLIPRHDPETSGHVTKLYGGCLMLPKAVLDQVGGFDERFFMYSEDVDLSRRVLDAGHKLYYYREATIVHIVGGASDKDGIRFSTLMHCESTGKLIAKYSGRSAGWAYRLGVFVGSLARLAALAALRILSLVTGRGKGLAFRRSALKYVLMLQWSLGLQRPVAGD